MIAGKLSMALVQYPVKNGAIEYNVKNHIRYAEQASRYGADIVAFPELSLSGYEPTLASALALDEDSIVLECLSAAAKACGVIIISGCPIKSKEGRPYVGAVISYPSGQTQIYRKQYLHAGELDYFQPGNADYFIELSGFTIALGICADFASNDHWASAKNQNANIYLSSALISEAGFELDSKLLKHNASEHSLIVALVNHNCETGGWRACGKSRVWGPTGEIVVASENKENSMVLCAISKTAVQGKVLKI